MSKKYSDKFKMIVVQDYYRSPLGVRMIAQKYNLPTKNYIGTFEKYLKKKGFLAQDATKSAKTPGRSKEALVYQDTRTEREKRYEVEIDLLKAKIAYLESLESLKPFLKKK